MPAENMKCLDSIFTCKMFSCFYRSVLLGSGLVLFVEQKCRAQFPAFIEPCRSTLLVVTGAVCRYHV